MLYILTRHKPNMKLAKECNVGLELCPLRMQILESTNHLFHKLLLREYALKLPSNQNYPKNNLIIEEISKSFTFVCLLISLGAQFNLAEIS
ncbi:hypothetical protein QVD17_10783 [Tagetes erecta]|uniref:Uncharacterized protein n=1 Tax=Tagetes erecta TaxID=13708 RepID=A0AAD8L1Y0_TARER|nr:hypothetical protein QVD17_10783 [Tagetes erecta]